MATARSVVALLSAADLRDVEELFLPEDGVFNEEGVPHAYQRFDSSLEREQHSAQDAFVSDAHMRTPGSGSGLGSTIRDDFSDSPAAGTIDKISALCVELASLHDDAAELETQLDRLTGFEQSASQRMATQLQLQSRRSRIGSSLRDVHGHVDELQRLMHRLKSQVPLLCAGSTDTEDFQTSSGSISAPNGYAVFVKRVEEERQVAEQYRRKLEQSEQEHVELLAEAQEAREATEELFALLEVNERRTTKLEAELEAHCVGDLQSRERLDTHDSEREMEYKMRGDLNTLAFGVGQLRELFRREFTSSNSFEEQASKHRSFPSACPSPATNEKKRQLAEQCRLGSQVETETLAMASELASLQHLWEERLAELDGREDTNDALKSCSMLVRANPPWSETSVAFNELAMLQRCQDQHHSELMVLASETNGNARVHVELHEQMQRQREMTLRLSDLCELQIAEVPDHRPVLLEEMEEHNTWASQFKLNATELVQQLSERLEQQQERAESLEVFAQTMTRDLANERSRFIGVTKQSAIREEQLEAATQRMIEDFDQRMAMEMELHSLQAEEARREFAQAFQQETDLMCQLELEVQQNESTLQLAEMRASMSLENLQEQLQQSSRDRMRVESDLETVLEEQSRIYKMQREDTPDRCPMLSPIPESTREPDVEVCSSEIEELRADTERLKVELVELRAHAETVVAYDEEEARHFKMELQQLQLESNDRHDAPNVDAQSDFVCELELEVQQSESALDLAEMRASMTVDDLQERLQESSQSHSQAELALRHALDEARELKIERDQLKQEAHAGHADLESRRHDPFSERPRSRSDCVTQCPAIEQAHASQEDAESRRHDLFSESPQLMVQSRNDCVTQGPAIEHAHASHDGTESRGNDLFSEPQLMVQNRTDCVSPSFEQPGLFVPSLQSDTRHSPDYLMECNLSQQEEHLLSPQIRGQVSSSALEDVEAINSNNCENQSELWSREIEDLRADSEALKGELVDLRAHAETVVAHDAEISRECAKHEFESSRLLEELQIQEDICAKVVTESSVDEAAALQDMLAAERNQAEYEQHCEQAMALDIRGIAEEFLEFRELQEAQSVECEMVTSRMTTSLEHQELREIELQDELVEQHQFTIALQEELEIRSSEPSAKLKREFDEQQQHAASMEIWVSSLTRELAMERQKCEDMRKQAHGWEEKARSVLLKESPYRDDAGTTNLDAERQQLTTDTEALQKVLMEHELIALEMQSRFEAQASHLSTELLEKQENQEKRTIDLERELTSLTEGLAATKECAEAIGFATGIESRMERQHAQAENLEDELDSMMAELAWVRTSSQEAKQRVSSQSTDFEQHEEIKEQQNMIDVLQRDVVDLARNLIHSPAQLNDSLEKQHGRTESLEVGLSALVEELLQARGVLESCNDTRRENIIDENAMDGSSDLQKKLEEQSLQVIKLEDKVVLLEEQLTIERQRSNEKRCSELELLSDKHVSAIKELERKLEAESLRASQREAALCIEVEKAETKARKLQEQLDDQLGSNFQLSEEIAKFRFKECERSQQVFQRRHSVDQTELQNEAEFDWALNSAIRSDAPSGQAPSKSVNGTLCRVSEESAWTHELSPLKSTELVSCNTMVTQTGFQTERDVGWEINNVVSGTAPLRQAISKSINGTSRRVSEEIAWTRERSPISSLLSSSLGQSPGRQSRNRKDLSDSIGYRERKILWAWWSTCCAALYCSPSLTNTSIASGMTRKRPSIDNVLRLCSLRMSIFQRLHSQEFLLRLVLFLFYLNTCNVVVQAADKERLCGTHRERFNDLFAFQSRHMLHFQILLVLHRWKDLIADQHIAHSRCLARHLASLSSALTAAAISELFAAWAGAVVSRVATRATVAGVAAVVHPVVAVSDVGVRRFAALRVVWQQWLCTIRSLRSRVFFTDMLFSRDGRRVMHQYFSLWHSSHQTQVILHENIAKSSDHRLAREGPCVEIVALFDALDSMMGRLAVSRQQDFDARIGENLPCGVGLPSRAGALLVKSEQLELCCKCFLHWHLIAQASSVEKAAIALALRAEEGRKERDLAGREQVASPRGRPMSMASVDTALLEATQLSREYSKMFVAIAFSERNLRHHAAWLTCFLAWQHFTRNSASRHRLSALVVELISDLHAQDEDASRLRRKAKTMLEQMVMATSALAAREASLADFVVEKELQVEALQRDSARQQAALRMVEEERGRSTAELELPGNMLCGSAFITTLRYAKTCISLTRTIFARWKSVLQNTRMRKIPNLKWVHPDEANLQLRGDMQKPRVYQAVLLPVAKALAIATSTSANSR